MECLNSIQLLIFSFSVHLCFSFALIPHFQSSCVKNATFNGSAAYWANLDRLPAQISSTNRKNFGFYNFTVGGCPDEVNAIGICRGEVNQDVCKKCIYDTVSMIRENCPNNTEAVGWSAYCMLHYSNRNIFRTDEIWLDGWRRDLSRNAAGNAVAFLEAANGVPQPSPPATSPPLAEGKSKKNSIAVPVVGSILGVVSIALCICITIRLKNALKKDGPLDEKLKAESLKHDFATVQAATNNFSDENKLGQGGFGPVYKGQLPSGQDVAVKRLSSSSGQGDSEFENEVLLVAKLQHRNLVRLIGFCLKGKERLLIYEFVPNASLDQFIFDPIKSAQLNWERRYRIIGGIARGLLYLHEDSQLRVIHRDLKPSNILLDAEMNPKIADFGMAKLSEVDGIHETTGKVVGTFGYMAPEYAKYGQFSIKTDVYSFGVLVLEIVSGQKNNSRRHGDEYPLNLLTLASENWREGTLQSIVDPNLREASTAEILRCIHISLLCVQENELLRPTMGSIVLMLTSESATLPTPSETAFSIGTSSQSYVSSSREFWYASASTNDMSITQLYPR